MKKIITGYVYRMFRSFEIWALLALLIFSSVFLFINRMNERNYSTEKGQFSLFDEEMKQYRFESLGVSDESVYKYQIEKIADNDYDVLTNRINYSQDELQSLFSSLGGLFIIPSVLMAIFIPIFFGRLFSDGTIKNLIACGYSNRQIYMSSLVLVLTIDLLLIAIESGLYALICLGYRWYPPIHLPTISALLLLQFLMLCTFTCISLAVLFVSTKKIAPIIVCFVIFAFVFTISMLPIEIAMGYRGYDQASVNEVISKRQEDGNHVNMRFDLQNFDTNYTYEGKDLIKYEDDLSPAAKNSLIAWIYLDPFMLSHQDYFNSMHYLMYRDGLIAVYCITNAFWIILSSSTGLAVFKKKELV